MAQEDIELERIFRQEISEETLTSVLLRFSTLVRESGSEDERTAFRFLQEILDRNRIPNIPTQQAKTMNDIFGVIENETAADDLQGKIVLTEGFPMPGKLPYLTEKGSHYSNVVRTHLQRGCNRIIWALLQARETINA